MWVWIDSVNLINGIGRFERGIVLQFSSRFNLTLSQISDYWKEFLLPVYIRRLNGFYAMNIFQIQSYPILIPFN